MELINIHLVSKNGKKTGRYFYAPVVKIGEQYHYCECIMFSHPAKKADVDIKQLKVGRVIQPEFYKANKIL